MTRSMEERWIPEETYGDRLRRIRRALGLSQEEFARRLGTDVGAKALGAWETGTREPRGAVALAKRIEIAYGVPAVWLLGLDVPTGPDGGVAVTPKEHRGGGAGVSALRALA